MTDTLVYAVAIALALGVSLLLRWAFRHLLWSAHDAVMRDERIAELVAHHWVDADLPDRYVDPVFRCGGCDFIGPTRLDHARHVAALIRRLDDADHRIAEQLQGKSRSP